MRILIGMAVLLLACAVVAAQCQSGLCQSITYPVITYPYYSPPVYISPPVVPPPQPAPAPAEEPKKEEAKPTEAAPPAKLKAPEGCSDGCVIEYTDEDESGPQVMNFGVDLGRMRSVKAPKYKINGVEVSRQGAIAAIESSIPDDAKLVRLTLIGSAEDRKRVMDDLDSHPGLKNLKPNLLVQAYDPTDTRVSKRGFVVDGKPSIYIMDPSGKVLARNTDGEYYGADNLAYSIGEVIGKPYSPDADKPLPKKPEPQPLALPKSLNDVPQWAWIAGAVAVFFYLQNRNKGAQS